MNEKYIVKSDSSSGVNTVLLIMLLLIVVAGVVWYFAYYRRPAATPQTEKSLNVEVNLPTGGDNTNGNDTTPSN